MAIVTLWLMAPSVRANEAAERGYRWLTTKAFGTADFSAAQFEQLWTIWPDPLRTEAEKAPPEERRRLAFSRYGLVEAPGRVGGAPLGYVDDGHGGWVINCLLCHGGKVAGRAIPGLGNSHFAFQTLTNDLTRLYIREKKRVPRDILERMVTPLGRSNGTTNAQIFSVALTSMRDADLNFTPPTSLPSLKHHDLDAPPLWNTRHKSHLYIDGFVGKSHRVIMQFVFTPNNSGPTIRAWDDDFRDILAWIESLRPPVYPWPVDQKLAAEGARIFGRTCAECHGTPDSYPEKRVPLEELGTDPVRLAGMPAAHRTFFSRGWISEEGTVDVVAEPDGYVAPPLDGIWASAPYFHNGSVPTLWHVLHPDERPAVWRRTEDGYDQERVGLEVELFDAVPAEVTNDADRRRFHDSGIAGKSAAGHDYPNALAEDAKRAVLEYLKTR